MIKAQNTHEAQKTLSDLRDHLARHDKPIAFFFGAGTSCAVKIPDSEDAENTPPLIPDVAQLTKICRCKAEELGDKYKSAWELINNQCSKSGKAPNIENILSRLRMMLGAIGDNDTLSGLNEGEIKILEENVRKTIAGHVTPCLERIPDSYPHQRFARWLAKTLRQSPVEIFTVNYDVLIEYALEAERIPIFDGFVGSYRPFFSADSLRRQESAPGANWVRLWKMHGSVTWRRIEENGRFRVVRGDPDTAGEMIYPSFQKYDESRRQPYSAFTDRLSRFLEQDDALLIVAGFSFGDEHINNLIFGALENRPRTHVYALQFEELSEENDVIKRAYQRSNIIVVGPETGIIGGRRATWAQVENPAFKDAVSELKSKEADSGNNVENTGANAASVKIGDFGSFCDFLESMITEQS